MLCPDLFLMIKAGARKNKERIENSIFVDFLSNPNFNNPTNMFIKMQHNLTCIIRCQDLTILIFAKREKMDGMECAITMHAFKYAHIWRT